MLTCKRGLGLCAILALNSIVVWASQQVCASLLRAFEGLLFCVLPGRALIGGMSARTLPRVHVLHLLMETSKATSTCLRCVGLWGKACA